jgi:hypothetical protein
MFFRDTPGTVKRVYHGLYLLQFGFLRALLEMLLGGAITKH